MNAPLLRYAGLDFVWLPDADVKAVGAALDDEPNRRWMVREGLSVQGTVERAAGLCTAGRCLYLAVVRPGGQIAGRCGLTPYRDRPGALQTSTHLAACGRRRGVNRIVKSALWELVLAHGHDRMLMSANVDNVRSRRAMRSVARDDRDGYLTDYTSMVELVHEDWYPRDAELVTLRRRPYGHVDFDVRLRAELEDRVRSLPSWPALRS